MVSSIRAALVGRRRDGLQQRKLLLLLVQISRPLFRDLFRLQPRHTLALQAIFDPQNLEIEQIERIGGRNC